MHITLNRKKYNLNPDKTLIMGILNITDDSFYDGGIFKNIDSAVKHAKQMEKDGADIIDIGGESSRPGANPVSEEEELKRILPVIKKLKTVLKIPISVDTYKPKVAEECLKSGAAIVNDITGLRDKNMAKVIAKYNAAVVIMHMKGNPKDMQVSPVYKNAVREIKAYLKKKINEAKKHGIRNIIIDPGIGFGKTVKHNLEIIKNLEEFKKLKVPVLIGVSRKSFIGKILNLSVNERLEGALAAASIAVYNGADILRVHDVKETVRAIRIVNAVKSPNLFLDK